MCIKLCTGRERKKKKSGPDLFTFDSHVFANRQSVAHVSFFVLHVRLTDFAVCFVQERVLNRVRVQDALTVSGSFSFKLASVFVSLILKCSHKS